MSRYRAPGGILFVANLAQKVLFDCEISGQLSDGHWENSKPHDHWMPWCDAKVEIAADKRAVGRTFWPRRDKYALTSPDLLSVVQGRMIGVVRLALALGYEVAEKMRFRVECDGTMEYPTTAGKYWDDERREIDAIGLEKLQAALAAPTYSVADLKSDLRDLMKIMRTGPMDRKQAFPGVEQHDKEVMEERATLDKLAADAQAAKEAAAMAERADQLREEGEQALRALNGL